MRVRFSHALLAISVFVATPRSADAASGPVVLFDAAHGQHYGNADWILDQDGCGNVPRYPTPSQSGITASTPGTYWSGAYSSFGVALAKGGYQLESLPPGSTFSYGSGSAQDLSGYDVLVIPEPNVRFTTSERTALRSFVQNGGGLFMIADHYNSDRNNDGWDSPEIFNDLMSGTTWGIHFQVVNESNNWFTEDPNANYTTDLSSPIVFTGPFGAARAGKGLSLHGSTSMTLDTTTNPTAVGHVFRAGVTPGSKTQVTLATASVGNGFVAAIGDSGPGEDATDGCSDTTYDDFDLTTRDNATIMLNTVAWLAGSGQPDTTAPTAPPSLAAQASSASQIDIAWTAATDDVGVTDYIVYKSTNGIDFWPLVDIAATSYTDTGLSPGTTYWYRVTALDAAVNESLPSITVSVTTPSAASAADVILNEILANEPGSSTAGEFVEIVNAGGAAADISGWTLRDGTGTRHTFAAGTVLPAGKAIVVFGAASAIPAGVSCALGASTGALGLANGGDSVSLYDASGNAIDGFTYPSSLSGTDGVSMNLDPDATASGSFVLHTAVSALSSSPCARTSGAAF